MAPLSAAPPGPHPDPPGDLDRHPLPLTTVHAGASWSRIYLLGVSPKYFDPSNKHRFNSPGGEFGVLYAGSDDRCAFVEAFGRNLGLRLVSMAELALRGRSRVEAIKDLRLVDLTGPGLARIRADGRLTTGDYRVAQRWSLALHRHPDQPDGIMWRSRLDQSKTCFAVYERAASSTEVTALCSLSNPTFSSQLAGILDFYSFGLV
jgi:hypothetical protein